MRDSSTENLKLHVTNIKSTLLNSNKQLRRVKIRKKSLIAKFEKQENFRKEESRLESPLGKIGSGISGVAGKITAPAKSFLLGYELLAEQRMIAKLLHCHYSLVDNAE